MAPGLFDDDGDEPSPPHHAVVPTPGPSAGLFADDTPLDDDGDGTPADEHAASSSASPRSSKLIGAIAAVVAVVVVAAVIISMHSSSSSSGRHVNRTAFEAYTTCLRNHGVPIPSFQPGGGFPSGGTSGGQGFGGPGGYGYGYGYGGGQGFGGPGGYGDGQGFGGQGGYGNGPGPGGSGYGPPSGSLPSFGGGISELPSKYPAAFSACAALRPVHFPGGGM